MCIDSFRIASSSDADAIPCLVNESYRPEGGKAGWTDESDLVSGNRTSSCQVLKHLAKPDSVILVGLRNSCIIACAHIEKDGDNSCIGMLAVSPTLQALGAGKLILNYAESYAETVFGSDKCVMVVVSSRTELIAFYMRRGYRKTGTVMDYPLSARVGKPKHAGLKIEILEKRMRSLENERAQVTVNEQHSPIAIEAAQAEPRKKSSIYPEPFASRMAGREKRSLGDLFGLTNFGVNLTKLQPGACSALRHAHSKQDEFIYILRGHPTLISDFGEMQLSPGMCAGFKAATGKAHQLLNRTDKEVHYLEVGDRSEGDSAAYPDDDLQAALVDGKWQFAHKDGSPY